MSSSAAAADIPAGLLESLRQAGRLVFLTGSGVSAESGVPTFRDALTGHWSRFRPEQLATPEAFAADPQRVWDWYRERRLGVAAVQPNGAHYAIAQFQALLPGVTLVTQNVDGLHQRAGATGVVEFHGNLYSDRCRACGTTAASTDPGRPTPPPCPRCRGPMGPGVVWFGETIPEDALLAAWRAAERADCFFSIGTSGLVFPAAHLAELARANGAILVEVNTDQTPLTARADFVLRGPAGRVLPTLLEAVRPDRS